MKDFQDVFSETGDSESLEFGGGSKYGKAVLKDGDDRNNIELSAEDGSIRVLDSNGNPFLYLRALRGNIVLGNAETNPVITMSNRYGGVNVLLDGHNANFTLGGTDNAPGDIRINNEAAATTVQFKGANASANLGGSGQSGSVLLIDGEEKHRIWMNAETGFFSIRDGDGNPLFRFSGSTGKLEVGGAGAAGNISVRNDSEIETIRISGDTGDIEFLNADFAEEFDVQKSAISEAIPGMVMVLNNDSELVPCETAYDHRVAGIISGAGKYKPGIVMDKTGGEHRVPIAMLGKVHCYVDADIAPISIGDLLTTSCHPGHAMKMSDPLRGIGAIIGKALAKMESGKGMIPVLVNLQ